MYEVLCMGGTEGQALSESERSQSEGLGLWANCRDRRKKEPLVEGTAEARQNPCHSIDTPRKGAARSNESESGWFSLVLVETNTTIIKSVSDSTRTREYQCRDENRVGLTQAGLHACIAANMQLATCTCIPA